MLCFFACAYTRTPTPARIQSKQLQAAEAWGSVDTWGPSGLRAAWSYFLPGFTWECEAAVTGSMCVCVLGHTVRRRCRLNLHTCILFIEAKTHGRTVLRLYKRTRGMELWNTVTYSVYSWLGRVSKYARPNGKATWLPLEDFVCSACSRLWGPSSQNSSFMEVV